MNTISSGRTKFGELTMGYELWQTMDGGYRLRTYHRNGFGVITSPHSVALSEQQVEQLAEDIHKFLFAQDDLNEELADLLGDQQWGGS